MKPTPVRAIFLWCVLAGPASGLDISGGVFDEDSAAAAGIIVRLASAGIADTTGGDGTYRLADIAPVRDGRVAAVGHAAHVVDGALIVTCVSPARLTASLYTVHGRRVHGVTFRALAPGRYRIPLTAGRMARGSYILETLLDGDRRLYRYTHAGDVSVSGRLADDGRSARGGAARRLDWSDTLTMWCDGQLVRTFVVEDRRRRMPDVYVARRAFHAGMVGNQSRVGAVEVEIEAPDGSVRRAEVATGQENGMSLCFEYFAKSADYRFAVIVYDTLGRTIGRSRAEEFTCWHESIDIYPFDLDNACPVADAGPDQTVMAGDTFALCAAAIDSFGGAIEEYRWRIDDGQWTPGRELTAIAPSSPDTLHCYLEVTDDDGNSDQSACRVFVRSDAIGDEELLILSPSDSDRFMTGERISITWAAGESAGGSGVGLAYSVDDGREWRTIEALVDMDGSVYGAVGWTVPEMQASDILIQVADYPSGACADTVAIEVVPRCTASTCAHEAD